MSFQNLGLSETVLHGAQRMGYSEPTPIQLRAIPVILSGRDLIASAQTGTGKTAAFALPVLCKLDHPEQKIRCLVLEPTAELAMQVETAFRDYMRFMHTEVTLIHGGVGYGKQKEEMARKVDVVVATPGRLLDHMQQGAVDLDNLEFLILDEVDRMLDIGISCRMSSDREMPKARQTLLFSATIPEESGRLASWCLKDPEKIEIGAHRSPAETVNHALSGRSRPEIRAPARAPLTHELRQRPHFPHAKDGADRICRELKKNNHSMVALHSNRTQTERVEALEGFKAGRYEVMVATDIAARGIDIAGVSHVVNYDVPAASGGLCPSDRPHRPRSERGRCVHHHDCGDCLTSKISNGSSARSVPVFKLDNFAYVYTAIFNETEAAAAAQSRQRRPHPQGNALRFQASEVKDRPSRLCHDGSRNAEAARCRSRRRRAGCQARRQPQSSTATFRVGRCQKKASPAGNPATPDRIRPVRMLGIQLNISGLGELAVPGNMIARRMLRRTSVTMPPPQIR